MPAEPLEDFLDDAFVQQTASTLRDLGFVADEHEFAPYRETLSEQVEGIAEALAEAGYDFSLRSGFVKHPSAGFAYFIFDEDRYEDHGNAAAAVSAWLDERYAER